MLTTHQLRQTTYYWTVRSVCYKNVYQRFSYCCYQPTLYVFDILLTCIHLLFPCLTHPSPPSLLTVLSMFPPSKLAEYKHSFYLDRTITFRINIYSKIDFPGFHHQLWNRFKCENRQVIDIENGYIDHRISRMHQPHLACLNINGWKHETTDIDQTLKKPSAELYAKFYKVSRNLR